MGSLAVPTEWYGKVKVYYSTAKNSERDGLTRHIAETSNAQRLTNPEGAKTTYWLLENEVFDWLP